jgi:hypothetical protein
MPTPTPVSMGDVLSGVSSTSTTLFGLVTKTVTFVVDNPLMLVFFSIAIVGSGVALFHRLRG